MTSYPTPSRTITIATREIESAHTNKDALSVKPSLPSPPTTPPPSPQQAPVRLPPPLPTAPFALDPWSLPGMTGSMHLHRAPVIGQASGPPAPPSTPVRRLCVLYPDMTLYASHTATIRLLETLRQKDRSSLICTNLDLLDLIYLGPGPWRVLTTPNAGGSSVLSEALSVELLTRMIGVSLEKTEMELAYSPSQGPITDYCCRTLHDPGVILGVSVTRALAYYKQRLSKAEAIRILVKKLHSILHSSETVSNCTFDRQILHIWTETGVNATVLRRVYHKLPEKLKSNTIVLITVVNNDSIFY